VRFKEILKDLVNDQLNAKKGILILIISLLCFFVSNIVITYLLSFFLPGVFQSYYLVRNIDDFNKLILPGVNISSEIISWSVTILC
jgi:hypothetical protein